jgi:hypothetical protein
MHLHLLRIHLVLGVVGGILVQVGQQDGLGVGGLDVLARAAVAVAAGADFVVEGAVYFVLLRAEDGGEVVRHSGSWRGRCVVGGVGDCARDGKVAMRSAKLKGSGASRDDKARRMPRNGLETPSVAEDSFTHLPSLISVLLRRRPVLERERSVHVSAMNANNGRVTAAVLNACESYSNQDQFGQE